MWFLAGSPCVRTGYSFKKKKRLWVDFWLQMVTEYTLLTPPPLRNFYQKKKKKTTKREKSMSEQEATERGQPHSGTHENFLHDIVQVRLDWGKGLLACRWPHGRERPGEWVGQGPADPSSPIPPSSQCRGLEGRMGYLVHSERQR